MADEKEVMLESVRRALGREGGRRPPPALDPFTHPRAADDLAGRLSRFRTELESAGGHVEEVDPASDARARLEEILTSLKPSTVALSDRVERRVPGLSEWLKGRGVGVVSTHREPLSGKGGMYASAGAPDAYRLSLLEADVGVTCADFALADTGSLVLVSGGERHRLASLLPPIHVCLLEPSVILSDLPELYASLKPDTRTGLFPNAVTLITGPSKTADIEQTLTVGVHGPRALFVLVNATGPYAG